jgi:hypothetical protein
MNKINPLYILLFFVFFAVIMAWMTSQKREQEQELLHEISLMRQEGEYIGALKSRWKDDAKDLQKLERITKRIRAKGDDIKVKKEKGMYRLNMPVLTGSQAEKFVNDVLNETINLESLELVRTGDNNISLTLECQL